MTRSGVLQRPDCGISYEVSGAGPALVFAHGLGGNHLSWWQQVAHFSATRTCVVFSHRGFAPSTPVAGGTAPDAYADDLEALLDALGIGEAVLVAQSMGGWTCLELALRAPQRVKALLMASSSGAVDFRRLAGPAAAEIARWLEDAPRALADLEARGVPAAGGERMAREQPALSALYAQISRLTPAAFRAAVGARIREMRTQPPERLRGLPMPVLFLTGDEDIVFPPAAGPALAALAPKGSALRVAQAGHSVYFERARQFNAALEEFLQST
jgi:pimeloyl-ACP methyl ester carboxylesterase